MARRRRSGLGSASGDCAVYVNAGNDANGNPRRGWVIMSGPNRKAFVDEGYGGRESLRRACPGVAGDDINALEIKPGQYRRLNKLPGHCPGGKKY